MTTKKGTTTEFWIYRDEYDQCFASLTEPEVKEIRDYWSGQDGLASFCPSVSGNDEVDICDKMAEKLLGKSLKSNQMVRVSIKVDKTVWEAKMV